ncbi:hypothetical protein [Palaeococcus ferrophilus]|uniref:hypothetical protein n=1 Tax=Palaeococcus ferrophilus TaxID=83868 RepID=UPI00064F33AE|nr:hypothetical protein [Palaeococcus ferrophilus]
MEECHNNNRSTKYFPGFKFSEATETFIEEHPLKEIQGLVQYTNGDPNSIYFPQKAEYTLLTTIEGKEITFESTSKEIHINKEWLNLHGISNPLILAPGFKITETETHYILSNGNGGIIRIVNINVKPHRTSAEIKWETNAIDGGDQYAPQVTNGHVNYGTSSLTNQAPADKTCTSNYLCSFTANLQGLQAFTTYHYQLLVRYQFTLPNGTPGTGEASVTGSFVTEENNPPETPELLSPQNGAYMPPGTVTLKWSGNDPDGDKIVYHVKIGLNGAIPAEYTTTENTQISLTLDSPETYYWQIVAVDSKGARSESETRFFTITSPSNSNHPPYKPSLLSPTNGQILTTNGDSAEVQLKWNCNDPDGDSLNYKLYLGPSPDRLSYLTTTASPHYSLTLKPGKYYWKVIAQDSNGAYKSSDVSNFIVEKNENITLKFYVLRVRQLRPGLVSRPDMYVKLTINGKTYKSPTWDNKEDVEKNSLFGKDMLANLDSQSLFTVTASVPKDRTTTIKLELYDSDLFGSDALDVSPSSNYAATIIYNPLDGSIDVQGAQTEWKKSFGFVGYVSGVETPSDYSSEYGDVEPYSNYYDDLKKCWNQYRNHEHRKA